MEESKMDQRQNAAELKLRRLAVDLKKAYGRATRHISAELKPIEVAVEEIGEPWRPKHYPEMVKEKGPRGVSRPLTCFARDTSVNGTEVEYLLCVARNPEMKCGLFVSVCKYQTKQAESEENKAETELVIKNTALVPTSVLPVPIRMKILDILEDFAAAYDEHVRNVRDTILTEWSNAEPAGAESEGESEEPSNGKQRGQKEEEKVKLFSPEDMNTPLEQWIPALSGKR
jgi:hypothetical protein